MRITKYKGLDAILTCGGKNFKIYLVPSIGILLKLGRKNFEFNESNPNYKKLMDYINLKYFPSIEQKRIENDLKKLREELSK